MKKTIISNAVWAAMAAMLCMTIADPSSGFANVALLVIWVLITLGSLTAVVTLMFAYSSEKLSGDPTDKIHSDLRGLVEARKKPSTLGNVAGWARLVVLVGLTAYAGFIVTAVAHVLMVMFVKFSILVGEKVLNDAKAKASCPEEGASA